MWECWECPLCGAEVARGVLESHVLGEHPDVDDQTFDRLIRQAADDAPQSSLAAPDTPQLSQQAHLEASLAAQEEPSISGTPESSKPVAREQSIENARRSHSAVSLVQDALSEDEVGEAFRAPEPPTEADSFRDHPQRRTSPPPSEASLAIDSSGPLDGSVEPLAVPVPVDESIVASSSGEETPAEFRSERSDSGDEEVLSLDEASVDEDEKATTLQVIHQSPKVVDEIGAAIVEADLLNFGTSVFQEVGREDASHREVYCKERSEEEREAEPKRKTEQAMEALDDSYNLVQTKMGPSRGLWGPQNPLRLSSVGGTLTAFKDPSGKIPTFDHQEDAQSRRSARRRANIEAARRCPAKHGNPQKPGKCALHKRDRSPRKKRPGRRPAKDSLRRITKTFLHTCHLCDKQVTKDGFRSHVLFSHTELNPFGCTLCSYSAQRRKQLAFHQLRSHGVSMSSATVLWNNHIHAAFLLTLRERCFGNFKSLPYEKRRCRPCNRWMMFTNVRDHIASVHLRQALHKCRLCLWETTRYYAGQAKLHIKQAHAGAEASESLMSYVQEYKPHIVRLTEELFDPA